jgi:hypothetical protein
VSDVFNEHLPEWQATNLEPYDRSFNAAVMKMASLVCPKGYDVVPESDAPESLQDLQTLVELTGRIAVSRDHSNNTIFGCPEHNWAFRAWHDWTHFILRAPFTLDGELSVANRQCEDIARVFGHGPRVREWQRLIMGEVYGQALYFDQHGHFPEDQPAVTLAYARSCQRVARSSVPEGWVVV